MISIKNIYLRAIVKWKKMRQKPFDEEQDFLYKIVLEMSSSLNTSCSMAPDSERYYMVNLDYNYFIVLTYDFIRFTNHDHYIIRDFNQEYLGGLILKVRKRIERDHEKLEKKMSTNEIFLLNKILKNLKEDNSVNSIENSIKENKN